EPGYRRAARLSERSGSGGGVATARYLHLIGGERERDVGSLHQWDGGGETASSYRWRRRGAWLLSPSRAEGERGPR
ncbi:hypothetical protein NHX12_009915, partial [Muraenolepis orangiensis]